MWPIRPRNIPDPWLQDLFDDMPGLRWVGCKDEPYLWQIGLARLRSIKLLELGKDAKTIQEMMVYTALMQVQAGRMLRAVRKHHHLKPRYRTRRR